MQSPLIVPLALRKDDRRRYQFRRVTQADIGPLADLLSQFSERTRYLRYMARRPLTPEMAQAEAARMVRGYTGRQFTLLATTGQRAAEELIAVAELVPSSQTPSAADIALAVRDDEQRKGIGTSLIKQLALVAQSSGITQLHADLLAENHPMRRLIQRLGLPYTATFGHGEAHLQIDVPPLER